MIEKRAQSIMISTADSTLPALLNTTGQLAEKRCIEFFSANFRNKNTRESYHRAAKDTAGFYAEKSVMNNSESLLQFTCQFPIKIIGKTDLEQNLLVIEIIRRHVPTIDENALTSRPV